MKKRKLWLWLGVALAGSLAAFLFFGDGRDARPERPARPTVASATTTAAPAPYRPRELYPRNEGEGAAAPEAGTPRPQASPRALKPVDQSRPARPAPPTGTVPKTALYEDYRNAVCACTTRQCVRDLQGSFIRRLPTTYSNSGDEARVLRVGREARICVSKLPVDS